jgi:hypothetical protein
MSLLKYRVFQHSNVSDLSFWCHIHSLRLFISRYTSAPHTTPLFNNALPLTMWGAFLLPYAPHCPPSTASSLTDLAFHSTLH